MRFTRADKPSLHMDMEHGPEKPTVSGGFGGWNVVARDRRVALTEWGGVDPMRATVSVMFDKFRSNGNVQPTIAQFMALFAPSSLAPAQPPQLRLSGAWPISSVAVWVVDGLDWVDYEKRSDGSLSRAILSVTLLQHVAGSLALTKPSPAKRAAAKASPSSKPAAKAKTYIVKRGDTLSAIAQKLLGNWRRYTEIAKLNGIRDPNHITPGQKLKIPG